MSQWMRPLNPKTFWSQTLEKLAGSTAAFNIKRDITMYLLFSHCLDNNTSIPHSKVQYVYRSDNNPSIVQKNSTIYCLDNNTLLFKLQYLIVQMTGPYCLDHNASIIKITIPDCSDNNTSDTYYCFLSDYFSVRSSFLWSNWTCLQLVSSSLCCTTGLITGHQTPDSTSMCHSTKMTPRTGITMDTWEFLAHIRTIVNKNQVGSWCKFKHDCKKMNSLQ